MSLANLSAINDLEHRSRLAPKGYLQMVHVRSLSRHMLRDFQSHVQILLQAICLIAAAIAMTSATVGCGQDGGNQQQGNTIAVAPLSNCAAGATYQGNAWGRTPYGQMNATPYGHGVRGFHPSRQSIRNEGFCDCAPGTQPMCDGSVGVVCLSTEMLSGADLALWQPGPQGLNFSGYAGYTAYGNVYDPRSQRRPVHRSYDPRYPQAPNVRFGHANQCASHIGHTCAVGTNSCDQGSYCRPLIGNPAVGVCAR